MIVNNHVIGTSSYWYIKSFTSCQQDVINMRAEREYVLNEMFTLRLINPFII